MQAKFNIKAIRKSPGQFITNWLLLLVFALSAATLVFQPVSAAGNTNPSEDLPPTPETPVAGPYQIFLSGMFRNATPMAPVVDNSPMMLGIYPKNWWAPNPEGVIAEQFQPLDEQAGKHLSLAGVFHSLDDKNYEANIKHLLPIIWDSGYTPFINMHTKYSAAQVANGEIDEQIRAWADAYAVFANGGQRMAFLAPMQEMNGYWVPYGLDPENYKLAFRRIRSIFIEAGVPEASMRWVFAPNGYTDRKHPPMEEYYPGSDVVDVIAISSYNFGYHPENSYKQWKTPQETFEKYITKAHALDPSKWVFVAQTGTTAYTASGYSDSAKNQWLEEALNYLSTLPGVKGVIYYNADINYDWSILSAGQLKYSGFSAGAQNPDYEYITPETLLTMPTNFQ